MRNVKWGIFLLFTFLICTLLCGCKEEKSNDSISSKVSELTEIIQNMIYYDALKVPDVILSTTNDERIMLSEIVTDELRMVVYLPTLGCSSCYERELELLQNTIPNNLKCKVAIIGKFSTNRELKLFERKCRMQTLKLDKSIKDFPIPFFDENPVAFLLNSEMLGFSFFDMVNHVGYSESYYNFVARRIQ